MQSYAAQRHYMPILSINTLVTTDNGAASILFNIDGKYKLGLRVNVAPTGKQNTGKWSGVA